MDVDAAFGRINLYIKNNELGKAIAEIDSIVAESSDDPFILVKCASLLKVMGDEKRVQNIFARIMEILPKDDSARFTVAVALRGLGNADDALKILEEMDESDKVNRESAKAYYSLKMSNEALSSVRSISEMTPADRILLTEILGALGKFDEAYSVAEKLVKDENNSYDSLVNKCSVMILMGNEKEAVKFVKSFVKEDKKNVDALALSAYVMRINGKTAAAANYAHHALMIDQEHIGALETMAMCLIEKKKFVEAKAFAGVINNKNPGHPAVIRILDACM